MTDTNASTTDAETCADCREPMDEHCSNCGECSCGGWCDDCGEYRCEPDCTCDNWGNDE